MRTPVSDVQQAGGCRLPSGQVSNTCWAMSPAESELSNRYSRLCPFTMISRRLICRRRVQRQRHTQYSGSPAQVKRPALRCYPQRGVGAGGVTHPELRDCRRKRQRDITRTAALPTGERRHVTLPHSARRGGSRHCVITGTEGNGARIGNAIGSERSVHTEVNTKVSHYR